MRFAASEVLKRCRRGCSHHPIYTNSALHPCAGIEGYVISFPKDMNMELRISVICCALYIDHALVRKTKRGGRRGKGPRFFFFRSSPTNKHIRSTTVWRAHAPDEQP